MSAFHECNLWGRLSRLTIGLGLSVLLAVGGVWSDATAAEEDPAPLRYGFEAGRTYVYELRLVGDLPDGRETWTGHSFYQVKAVDARSGQMTLANWGHLTPRKEAAPATRTVAPRRGPGFGPRGGPAFGPRGLPIGPTYGTPREFTLDPLGNVVRYQGAARTPRIFGEGDSQLPFLLGELWLLLADPLPRDDQPTWTTETQLVLTRRADPFPVPPPFRESQVTRTARQTVRYSLGETAEQAVAIAKEYELVTEEQVDDQPALSQTGKGEIRFDQRQRVPASMEMEYRIEMRAPQVTVTIPVTVSARLIDEAEAEQVVKDRDEAIAAARARMEARRQNLGQVTLDGDELDKLLAALGSESTSQAGAAAMRLARAEPVEERRREVAEALEPLLSGGGVAAVAAVEALGTWGSAEDVPRLIAMLEGNMVVRQAAITALGKHPDERGAEAVAQHMSSTQTRRQAGQALRSMGAAAEAAVAPLLDHTDWIVRLEAAKILGAIGTEKSIAPLEAFRANSRGSGITEADKAIKAIRERHPDATEGE
jgi:hypothetical protein